MHLLQARPGGFTDEEGIVSLQQSPADVVVLSSADTELSLLARTYDHLADYPTLRLANLLHLRQHAAIDLYIDEVLQHARLIVVSLLGGKSYWEYGIDRLVQLCTDNAIPLVLVPGDDAPDPGLTALATVAPDVCDQVWRYLREGGKDNTNALFGFLGNSFLNRSEPFAAPAVLPKFVVYHPANPGNGIDLWNREWQPDQAVAAILFYRAHLQAGNLDAFDQLIHAVRDQGLNPLPVAISSLKEPLCLQQLETICRQTGCRIILNSTGFALSTPGPSIADPLGLGIPVFQVIFSGGNRDDWENWLQGMSARDLAMNVALPELDGRIITRAVSFKDTLHRSEATESDIVGYRAVSDRISFVCALAKNWVSLGLKPNQEKRIAILLANYPTLNGRIGNGVGLDTPASVVDFLQQMHAHGYPVEQIPGSGTALIQQLLTQVTNDPDGMDLRACSQSLALSEYRRLLATLPAPTRQKLQERWGNPEDDPMVRAGRIMIPGIRLGLTFIGIQPARGYHLDPAATYHDPDLIPPHAYLAFYFWLRHVYRIDAVIHFGKHGNLEWLPGKSIALSARCWPDLILGPLPNIYPFIVNDPGEGAQAKRRSQAVIIDHLVPPLTRAETYGPLQTLEAAVDEYYEAQSLDPVRARMLKRTILQLIQDASLHSELGFAQLPSEAAEESELLNRLDAYLCEIKESQIRNGLHIFGRSPEMQERAETLVALARLPHADGKNENRGLLQALCDDLGLNAVFDPLHHDPAESWQYARPALLASVDNQPWRSCGDTLERLEKLALQLIQALPQTPSGETMPATTRVLERIERQVAPALDRCAGNETAYLLQALDAGFIPAGPSGAPSRGCLDVLPTGRNFYSVDIRAIPSPTAWRIGFRSADRLIERYLQDHGDYPRTLGLSVWGTSTMRTGGDDIAQALALLGIRPVWSAGSNRVTDFEILPLDLLDRPRIDIMLRISGFFRDAFPNVISLFDAAVQAVAELDEPGEMNPVRQRVQQETDELEARGIPPQTARTRAGWRIFGSRPGAYGAGLQGLINEHCWQTRADLADAYINWGGYAYGRTDSGTPAREAFSDRLGRIEAVVQNQDNREHDILDSDDYYQFQGGMAAAVEVLRGEQAAVYHGDHSRPDQPRIRSLDEEINRVIRARVVNPKWINSIKKHGYKGAFEIAATVDYLFAYDATCQVVDDYQYRMVSEAYVFDTDTRNFMQRHNPHALLEMTSRLLEAIQRGLWKEPGEDYERLQNVLLETEGRLEQSE